jgi:methyltransferase-like protein
MPRDLGQFDYIIAHGLFSWVPPLVREKILAICRENLAPQGIAYISYNALPGCHIRRVMRDMMRHHVRHIDEPTQKIEQAVAFAHFLATGKASDKDGFALMLRDEIQGMIDKKDRAVLYHDDLADINQPFYFHEFMALAAARDLQFLGEAEFAESSDQPYPPAVREFLRDIGQHDPMEREQYLDFLKCRRFRQSLLVRKEVALDRERMAERVKSLSVSSRAKPESAPVSMQPGVKMRFSEPSGAAVAVDVPVGKAALLYLGESYPLPIRFAALVADVEKRLDRTVTADEVETLCVILHTAFVNGLVELHAGPPTFVRSPGERPVASPLARLQLAQGQEIVTSLRHSPIRVENALSRQLIHLLDGTRDRAALLDDLCNWAAANPPPNQAVPSPSELRKLLAGQLEPGLQSVAGMGLLVA